MGSLIEELSAQGSDCASGGAQAYVPRLEERR